MDIYDTVNVELKKAMRARDKARVAGLRNIRAAFIEAQKADGSDTVDDETCLTLLRRLAKQRRESIDAYEKGGRDDLAASEQAELAVIEAFLPQLADEATTREWVKAAIEATGATSARDLGKVMGELMKAHKGEIDGKRANVIARELIAG